MTLKNAVPAVLLAIMLAGCSGAATDATPDDGPVITDATGKTVVDDAPSNQTTKTDSGKHVAINKALVHGRVHDDFNFSLKGAIVSVVGTARYTQTNETGHYVLENLTVGTFDLRFEMDQFKAQQHRVTLEAGEEVRLDAGMLPVNPRQGDENPHIHNPWGEATTRVIMDHEISVNEDNAGWLPSLSGAFPPAVLAANCGRTDACRHVFSLPEQADGKQASIWPATKEIRVTFDWSGQFMVNNGMRLDYMDPTVDPRFNQWASTETVEKGGTVTLQVPRELQDHGHAEWTAWRFAAVTVNSQNDPGFVMGKIHIKMELVRGESILDPPHEDFWKGREQLSWAFTHDPSGVGVMVERPSRTDHLYVFSIPACPEDAPPACIDIIPPGTDRLEVRFSWSQSTQGLTAPWDHSLTYRTADQNPQTTPASDFQTPTILEQDLDEDWILYEIPVSADDADRFYMQYSEWAFKWHQDTDLPYMVAHREFKFDLEITAYKR